MAEQSGGLFNATYIRKDGNDTKYQEEDGIVVDAARYDRADLKLNQDYGPNHVINTRDNNDFYLINGGIVEIGESQNQDVGEPVIMLRHEERSGLEKMARTLDLPIPSETYITKSF